MSQLATMTRLTQVGDGVEAVEGTEESLVAANFQGNFKEDSHEYEIMEYDRELKRAALSSQGVIPGARRLRIRKLEEFAGGSASAHAPCYRALRGCGWYVRGTALKIEVGAPSGGDFVFGDLIGDNATSGSKTKSGMFLKYHDNGTIKVLWYLPVSGLPFGAADTIYNYASSQVSTAADSASTPGGWVLDLASEGAPKSHKIVEVGASYTGTAFVQGTLIGDNATFASCTKLGMFVRFIAGTPNKIVYLPIHGTFANTDTFHGHSGVVGNIAVDSAPADTDANLVYVPESVTRERRIGGKRHTVVGGRGDWTFTLRHSEPMLIETTIEGPAKLEEENAGTEDWRPRLAAAVSGVTTAGVAPRMGLAVPLTLAAWSPVCTELTIRGGQTLAPRPTISEAALESSGYMATRITDREVTIATDPENPAAATFDAHQNILSVNYMLFYAEVGKLNHGNGMLILSGPELQLKPTSVGESDRDGIVTLNVEGVMVDSTGADAELRLAHLFA